MSPAAPDNLRPDPDDVDGTPSGYDIESAPVEIEQPRRAASATFVVEGQAGDAATLRAAMDPANQSLGEALRLSYRILQLVILVLVVLFLFSGFQTVQEGSTGVRTLFGRIVGEPGQEQLGPGFTPFWPYPAGEIVTLPLKRAVEVDRAFWPRLRRGDVTMEQAMERASDNDMFKPGEDGTLITADGDLVHLRIAAEYTIDDAVDFLGRIDPAKSDKIVQRVLQRAAVHAAASMTAADIIDLREEPVIAIRTGAQRTLDAIGSGLTLVDPTLPLRSLPFAVRNETPKVQAARQEAQAAVVKASESAEKSLTAAAGEKYGEIVVRIRAYEEALAAGEEKLADGRIAAIIEQLEGPLTSGEASRILGRAKAYQSQVDATVGNDYQRYLSLLPAYKENPRLLIQNLWLDAYQEVLEEPLLEIVSVPFDLGSLNIAAKSSSELMQERRRADLERRKNEANSASMTGAPQMLWGRDTARPGGKNRRLERGADAGFGKGGGS